MSEPIREQLWRDVAEGFSDHSIGTSLKDWAVTAHYQGRIAKDIAMWIARQGPADLIANLRRYPWFSDFFTRFEYFFARLVLPRTGHYREANAMLVHQIIKITFVESLGAALMHPERMVLHEDLVPPEILLAMDLKPWMTEIVGILMPVVHPPTVEAYIDHAENHGIAPDTCSLPKATLGLALMDHLPRPAAVVTSNMPCDAGMTSYEIIEDVLQVPMFRLDIPHDFKSEAARDYFVGELKRMIDFLERTTPGKMNWERLREICETRNRTLELELDLWQMLRNRPAPLAAEPVLYNHLIFMQLFPGHPAGVPYFEKLLAITERALREKKGALPEERHRALLWNPMTLSFPDLFTWSEAKWGTAVIMDMLSYRRHPFVDTTSPESMLRDLATIMMNGPMARHTRGPVENFFTDLFYLVDHFDLDMIWMAEHVGCKNTKALNGMFRELCRERKIPLLFINYDLTDARVAPPADVRRQIDTFMESVMKAEPLDSWKQKQRSRT